MSAMGRPKTVNCKKCGGHIDQVGPLSARKLCENCGIGEMERNAYGLANYETEALTRWRRGMARSIGAILPGDVSSDSEN